MAVFRDTVRTDRFEMDYCRFGHGKRTLVILPGLSVQPVTDVAEAVEAAYRVMLSDFTIYLFDRRREVPDGMRICDLAQDTADALRELGLERVDVHGVSQGGMIAMELALMCPNLVGNLVLGSTAPCADASARKVIDGWVRLARAKDAEGLFLSFGEAIYSEDFLKGARQALIDISHTVTEADLARFIPLAQAMDGFDVTRELKEISCPVLVIGSRDDKVLGAEASRKLFLYLVSSRYCELFMYEGYGHAAYDTAPDYKERVLDFLLEQDR